MWLLSADGVQQNVMPYQIRAIDRGPDGHRYARFAETPTGWPLAQCARADPPATVRPPPCAVCGGMERWDASGDHAVCDVLAIGGEPDTRQGRRGDVYPRATTMSLLSSEALRGHRS